MDSAIDIVQDFLDRQGDATVAGDIDATLAFCDLPCTLDSLDGSIVVTTETQMRAVCLGFINSLRARQVTYVVRRCQDAVFKDGDTIWATYETRYVSDTGVRAEEPYAGFVILRRRAGIWKISTMQFAVTGDTPVAAGMNKILPGKSPK